ncbi:MAG TPA: hypothetical protein VEL76_30550 [Gemmataceae bacterium]|nr:hypothetical protein [Gemmataceae bacterium]
MIIVVALAYWWLLPAAGSMAAQADQIRVGMTPEQVQALFGAPPRRKLLAQESKLPLEIGMFRKPPNPGHCFTSAPYALTIVITDEKAAPGSKVPWDYKWFLEQEARRDRASTYHSWAGEEGEVEVLFGRDGRVADFKLWPKDGDSLRHRLRSWLGL